MKWTKTAPTKPGAYWWKHPECCHGAPILLEAHHQADVLVLRGFAPTVLDEQGGEWCGPLVPEEGLEVAYKLGYTDSYESIIRFATPSRGAP